MQMLSLSVLTCYFLVMPVLFWNWITVFRKDRGMSSAERQLSLVVLAIATLLWPIVLPLSYLELLGKVKRYERYARLEGFPMGYSNDLI
ncbi:MAG: hypothetical protein VKJ24_06750 [Synechococcales bacterium]|nr:hypothetical protein [Synechococcales bacterium]